VAASDGGGAGTVRQVAAAPDLPLLLQHGAARQVAAAPDLPLLLLHGAGAQSAGGRCRGAAASTRPPAVSCAAAILS